MKYICTLLVLGITTMCAAQPAGRLKQQLLDSIKGFHGDVGIYVRNISTGAEVAIAADTLFPTASTIKIAIMLGIMDKLKHGALQYHQVLQYNDSLLYPGVDLLGSFKNNEKIELSKLLMLMMTMSDNTASVWLQQLAGTGTRINQLLDSAGFAQTRINSRTPGREAARSRYGWGQTTARELAALVARIYEGKMISREHSTRMLRLMNRNYWDEEALSQIPPYATVFSKNGALDAYRSEVVLVRGIKSTYVFSIITNNNADQSWSGNNEAERLIKKISRLLWNSFEPYDPDVTPPALRKRTR